MEIALLAAAIIGPWLVVWIIEFEVAFVLSLIGVVCAVAHSHG